MSLQNTNICPYSGDKCAEKKDVCNEFLSEDKENCVSKIVHPSIVCSEKGMRYELINDNRSCVKKIIIDDCLITNKTIQKCDYAILLCNSEICCFIELKGSDITHACDQILHTYGQLTDLVKKCKKIYARIIPSRCPTPNIRSRPRELLRNLCKSNKGDLKIQTNNLTDKASEL